MTSFNDELVAQLAWGCRFEKFLLTPEEASALSSGVSFTPVLVKWTYNNGYVHRGAWCREYTLNGQYMGTEVVLRLDDEPCRVPFVEADDYTKERVKLAFTAAQAVPFKALSPEEAVQLRGVPYTEHTYELTDGTVVETRDYNHPPYLQEDRLHKGGSRTYKRADRAVYGGTLIMKISSVINFAV